MEIRNLSTTPARSNVRVACWTCFLYGFLRPSPYLYYYLTTFWSNLLDFEILRSPVLGIFSNLGATTWWPTGSRHLQDLGPWGRRLVALSPLGAIPSSRRTSRKKLPRRVPAEARKGGLPGSGFDWAYQVSASVKLNRCKSVNLCVCVF